MTVNVLSLTKSYEFKGHNSSSRSTTAGDRWEESNSTVYRNGTWLQVHDIFSVGQNGSLQQPMEFILGLYRILASSSMGLFDLS
jgi:hypothetical protein